jgi:hypothetical protein
MNGRAVTWAHLNEGCAMLAMHYQFTLPADYDMRIIRGRIAARGQAFDAMPGLVYKQFLMADITAGAMENLYAPVYVWTSTEAAHSFLQGPLFSALSVALGRPPVTIGLIHSLPGRREVEDARALTRVTEHPDFTAAQTLASQTPSAMADRLGWDEPHAWRRTMMLLDPAASPAGKRFEVAYLARGAAWEDLA